MMNQPALLSDYIMEALAAINRARTAVQDEKIVRREAVTYALADAERSLGHVLGLIAGAPN